MQVSELDLPTGHYAGALTSLADRGLVVKVAAMGRKNWRPNRWWLTPDGVTQARLIVQRS